MSEEKARYPLPFSVEVGGSVLTIYNGPGSYQKCLDQIARSGSSQFTQEVARVQLRNADDWHMGNPLTAARNLSELPSRLNIALERLIDSDLD